MNYAISHDGSSQGVLMPKWRQKCAKGRILPCPQLQWTQEEPVPILSHIQILEIFVGAVLTLSENAQVLHATWAHRKSQRWVTMVRLSKHTGDPAKKNCRTITCRSSVVQWTPHKPRELVKVSMKIQDGSMSALWWRTSYYIIIITMTTTATVILII